MTTHREQSRGEGVGWKLTGWLVENRDALQVYPRKSQHTHTHTHTSMSLKVLGSEVYSLHSTVPAAYCYSHTHTHTHTHTH